ncbi:MAG: Nif3-like dinuclear metal center hexameric protein [Bacteroidetes bacterium]|nr:Nif3-like dinuclear metal center hexameric protein [Bacteroidota bacterium]MDA0904085.1 Nif3-like dinuclear metal center hexameric protein [Bacteroidota bacterium]MDA1243206.1 Nif3-like dinuclear metal center hexameric protein [Bacteroidota bacterium]
MENALKVRDIAACLEAWAPRHLAESYDNVGLLVGEPSQVVKGVMVSLDCTEEVVREAIASECNMIVSHHPLIFKGIKRLNGSTDAERAIMLAIQQGMALYAIHTNLDNVLTGVNHQLAHVLGCAPHTHEILRPMAGGLEKWTVFVPTDHAESVRHAMADAGAGHIGKYDHCSFAASGTGSFRALEGATPFVGALGEIHRESEIRLEMVVRSEVTGAVYTALQDAHPYEEVALDRVSLENGRKDLGAGMVGELPAPMAWQDFVDRAKQVLGCTHVKITAPTQPNVQRVACCGGSGAFLIEDAKRAGADVYVTSDIKYHEYFQAEGQILLLDVGHYESEWQTSGLIASKLKEKFPNFAVRLSTTRTNPVSFR